MKPPLPFLSLALCAIASTACAQSLTLTFQGRLGDQNRPAQGHYDLLFAIYDAPVGGTQTSATTTNAATVVTRGLFATLLKCDAGAFTNGAAWLEISVRTNGGTEAFTVLNRQPLTAQPGAQQAEGQNPQTAAATPRSGRESLPQISEQQAQLLKIAKAQLAAQKSAPPSAMQSAAEALQKANNAISPLSSGALGQLPQGAQAQLQSAQGETAEGSAEASAGQNAEAQQSAQAAAQALAQAQAALSLAQAGVGSQAAMGQGQGKQPGQGGKGQQPGQGEGQGQGKGQAQGRSQGQPNPQGDGNRGNFDGPGGADGRRNGTAGSSQFTKLPTRDRAALIQSQAEKYPQEFGPLVEQYLRNLSDQAGEK